MEKAKRGSNSLATNRNLKIISVLVGILVVGIIAFVVSVVKAPKITDMWELAVDIKQGHVESVIVSGSTEVFVTYVDGTTALTKKDASRHFYDQMDILDVPASALQNLSYTEQSANNQNSIIFQFVIPLLPILLIIVIVARVIRLMHTPKAKQ